MDQSRDYTRTSTTGGYSGALNVTGGWKVTKVIGSAIGASFRKTDVVYIAIGMLGILDNLFAIAVMLFHRPLRQRLANWFLVNKTSQDLLTGVFLVLVNAVDEPKRLNGALHELYCRLWMSKAIFVSLFTSSLFSLVAVTFEKYLEIAHPIRHRVHMTRARVLWAIGGLTAFAFGFKVTYVVSTSKVVNGTCRVYDFPDFVAQVFTGTLNLMLEFFVPLFVIACSYLGIALTLRRSVQPAAAAAASSGLNRRLVRARGNVVKTLVVVVVAFVVCVSFKEALLLGNYYGLLRVDFYSWSFVVSQILSYLSCCIDPFIYLLIYEEFRRGAKKLLMTAFSRRCIATTVANSDNRSSVRTLELY